MSYAIGGALALAIAGVPRGTADVDVNVFVPEARVHDVIAVLSKLGIDFPAAAAEQARREGMFVGRWDGMRIDVRGKDLVDLERLVAVRPELDTAYVRRWIVDMMGDDDDRTRRWDDIVRRHRSQTSTRSAG